MEERLLENYNRLVTAKRWRKSDNPFPEVQLKECHFIQQSENKLSELYLLLEAIWVQIQEEEAAQSCVLSSLSLRVNTVCHPLLWQLSHSQGVENELWMLVCSRLHQVVIA
jgi:hypothetical protein